METIYNTIKELSSLKPDYISVTYGAAGSEANNRAAEISDLIKNKHGIEALPHLTSIGFILNSVRIEKELENLG